MAKKTRLMLRVEAERQAPLEELLPRMVRDKGVTAAAAELGVSKPLLGYWMLKLGIKVRPVVGPPDLERENQAAAPLPPAQGVFI